MFVMFTFNVTELLEKAETVHVAVPLKIVPVGAPLIPEISNAQLVVKLSPTESTVKLTASAVGIDPNPVTTASGTRTTSPTRVRLNVVMIVYSKLNNDICARNSSDSQGGPSPTFLSPREETDSQQYCAQESHGSRLGNAQCRIKARRLR